MRRPSVFVRGEPRRRMRMLMNRALCASGAIPSVRPGGTRRPAPEGSVGLCCNVPAALRLYSRADVTMTEPAIDDRTADLGALVEHCLAGYATGGVAEIGRASRRARE